MLASAEEVGGAAEMVLDKEIVISSLVVTRCKLPPSTVDGSTKVLERHTTMGCVIRARALANSGGGRVENVL